MWSINHSQGAEILCKVFGDDSWLVGAAERELGFAGDVESWHSLSSTTCVYVERCFCLWVCVCVQSGTAGGTLACGRWGNCYLQLAPQALDCVCIWMCINGISMCVWFKVHQVWLVIWHSFHTSTQSNLHCILTDFFFFNTCMWNQCLMANAYESGTNRHPHTLHMTLHMSW